MCKCYYVFSYTAPYIAGHSVSFSYQFMRHPVFPSIANLRQEHELPGIRSIRHGTLTIYQLGRLRHTRFADHAGACCIPRTPPSALQIVSRERAPAARHSGRIPLGCESRRRTGKQPSEWCTAGVPCGAMSPAAAIAQLCSASARPNHPASHAPLPAHVDHLG